MPGHIAVDIDRMTFRAGTDPLIERLRFEIEGGQIAAFVGASGAGKTTLLRIIAGLETNYEGCVMVDGNSVTGASRARQLVFQDTRLFPWMSALENVAFACPDEFRARRYDLAKHWLGQVGLGHRMSEWPHTLSGGEKSRVALARALIDPPVVLLLDEPLSGLDIGARLSLIDLIATLGAKVGFTTIFVSHETHDAVLLADEVFVLAAQPLRIQRRISLVQARPRQFGDEEMISAMNEIRSVLLNDASVQTLVN
jgi:sulfonate transport system ATP-binding protein